MRKMIAIAGLTFALTTSAYAEELTAADVAALPQDRVRKIIKECHMADNNLVLQDMCERMQLEALKRIVDRGTYRPDGLSTSDGYSKPARDDLKKLIEKPAAR